VLRFSIVENAAKLADLTGAIVLVDSGSSPWLFGFYRFAKTGIDILSALLMSVIIPAV
jgi:hypothetical protein